MSSESKDKSLKNSLVEDFKEHVSSATNRTLAILGAIIVIWINVFEHRDHLQGEAWSMRLKAESELKKSSREAEKADAKLSDAQDQLSMAKQELLRLLPSSKDGATELPEVKKEKLNKAKAAQDKSRLVRVAQQELDAKSLEVRSRSAALSLAVTAWADCTGTIEFLGMKLTLPLKILGPVLNLIILGLVGYLYWQRLFLWSLCAEIMTSEFEAPDGQQHPERSALMNKVTWWLAPLPILGLDSDDKRILFLERIGWKSRHVLYGGMVAITAILIASLQYHVATQGAFSYADAVARGYYSLVPEDQPSIMSAPAPQLSLWSVLIMALTFVLVWLWFRPKALNFTKEESPKSWPLSMASTVGVLSAILTILFVLKPDTRLTEDNRLWQIVKGNPLQFMLTTCATIAALVFTEIILRRRDNTRLSEQRRWMLRCAAPLIVGALSWRVGREFWRLNKRPRFQPSNRRTRVSSNFIQTTLDPGWYQSLRKTRDNNATDKPTNPEGIIYYISISKFALCGDTNRVAQENLSRTTNAKSPLTAKASYVPKKKS